MCVCVCVFVCLTAKSSPVKMFSDCTLSKHTEGCLFSIMLPPLTERNLRKRKSERQREKKERKQMKHTKRNEDQEERKKKERQLETRNI